MNIRDATILAMDKDLFIKKRDSRHEFTLYVAAGSVFRMSPSGEEYSMDARDVVGDDWYVVDADDKVIAE